jgi:cation diffusion facilitator family transporter
LHQLGKALEKERQLWLRISLIISIILLLVKFTAYYFTHSTAILSDALESIANVVAAMFATFSVFYSSLPKDENHPYGHGKIEFFSAGVEGSLIIFAGLYIIYQAIYNLFVLPELEMLPLGILLIAFTGLVNGALGYILKAKGKKLNSVTMEASGKHLITDTVTSIALILGVLLIYLTKITFLDSVISIGFSLYILKSGYQMVRQSVAGLMDEANPEALQATVKGLIKARKSLWIDIHNLRVQQYGGDRHIDLHLTLPYYLNLKQVHEEVEVVEEVLEGLWSGHTEVFIHADPCLPKDCCHYCHVKECPVRKFPNELHIEWNSSNMSKNQKHYHEALNSE